MHYCNTASKTVKRNLTEILNHQNLRKLRSCLWHTSLFHWSVSKAKWVERYSRLLSFVGMTVRGFCGQGKATAVFVVVSLWVSCSASTYNHNASLEINIFSVLPDTVSCTYQFVPDIICTGQWPWLPACHFQGLKWDVKSSSSFSKSQKNWNIQLKMFR